ncbi:MAG TPA: hypothetical protein VGB37_03155 [Candidatus Lokiarchaeia archaeon]
MTRQTISKNQKTKKLDIGNRLSSQLTNSRKQSPAVVSMAGDSPKNQCHFYEFDFKICDNIYSGFYYCPFKKTERKYCLTFMGDKNELHH